MADIQHKNIADADRHEPKGASTAASGTVYVSNGSGSGSWTTIGSMVLLSTQTASASTSLNFTGISSTYGTYLFILEDIRPATDGAILYFRTSTNGGGAYDSGATNYTYRMETDTLDSGPAVATISGGQNSGIQLTGQVGNASDEGVSGMLYLIKPSGTTRNKMITGRMHAHNTSGTPVLTKVDGYRAATTDIDAVRFIMSAGNITSGSIKMYGIE